MQPTATAPDRLQTVVGASCRNCGEAGYAWVQTAEGHFLLPAILTASECRLLTRCTCCGVTGAGLAIDPAPPDVVHSRPTTLSKITEVVHLRRRLAKVATLSREA